MRSKAKTLKGYTLEGFCIGRVPYMWGSSTNLVRGKDNLRATAEGSKPWDHHLLSTNDVNCHGIKATDGETG